MLWNADMWREMERLRRDMNGLFSGYESTGKGSIYPLVNVYDNGNSYTVTAELPGLSNKDINVTFSDNDLIIKGNVPELKNRDNVTMLRKECSSGSFEKSLALPGKVNPEKINAAFKNGILTVTLEKAEEAKLKTIEISGDH